MTSTRRALTLRRAWIGLLLFLDQRWIHFLLVACLMHGVAALGQRWGGMLPEFLDHTALNLYFESRGAQSPADIAGRLPQTRDIVMVELRHSVPRALLAKLLNQLRLAKVVAFDLMFRDQEKELGEDEKGWYHEDIQRWRREVRWFAASIKTQGRVVLGTWPEEKMVPDKQRAGAYHLQQIWRQPPALLWHNARSGAHLLVEPDAQDQVVRSVRLFENTPQKTPCLGLAIAAIAAGWSPREVQSAAVRDGFLFLKGRRIAVDARGQMLIDYVGGRESFEYETNRIVYERVLDLYEPEDFKDKIVIIGETGTSSKDILTTPFGPVAGMQIHANIVATLLSAHGPPAPLKGWHSNLLTLAACLLLAVLLLRLPLWAGFMVALIEVGGVFLLGVWIFCDAHRVLGMGLPIIAIGLTYNGIALYEYRRARETLGKFIGHEMVAQTLHVFSRLQLGGRTEQASAFFCDVRGYSTLSETRSPDDVTRLVNEYTGALAQVVKRHQGRLIDYQGDGVFVLFERSLAGENHGVQAVRAAVELQEVFAALRQGWAARGAPELEIGIGIETGMMTIGIVGAQERMMFSALGHAVNVAARVQGWTKQCGYGVLITQNTYEQVKDAIAATCCGPHQMKGIQQPIVLYGLVPSLHPIELDALDAEVAAR